jgi:hypothetical protein
MDFDDETNDVRSTSTTTSSSRGIGSFASSSSSSSSSSSIISSRRRRRDDNASVVSVVRGAGAGAWAVQDAGTYQMLHDDCTYLCSTMLVSAAAAKLQSQALEAALDLAQLLQHRKTRSVLWQGGGSGGSSGGGEREAKSTATNSSQDEPEPKRAKHTTTVLENILQVLSQAGKGTASSSRSSSSSSIGKPYYEDGNSSAASSVCGSPPRAGGGSGTSSLRTKSARRKLKQQSTIASNGGAGAGGIGGMVLSPELKQVLACILYFLSWDCTLSEHHSVASMGKQGVPSVARKVRQTILEHGGALQGILRLTLPPPQQQRRNATANAAWEPQTHSAPFSASAASSPTRKPQPVPSSAPSSPPTRTSSSSSSRCSIVKTSKVRGRLGTTHPPWEDSGASVQSSSLHSTSAGSSVSSVSFQEDAMGSAARSATTSSQSDRGGGGDPTAAGRRNRKKRKQSMPSVPEEDDDGFGFGVDFHMDGRSKQILPPPPSRQRGDANANTSTMSFTSEDTTSRFPTPTSPPRRRRQTPAAAPATSPDRSIASSSSSVAASEYSVLPARLSQKLKTLVSKVSLSSKKNPPSANLDTIQPQNGNDNDDDDPWVSMVCLESIHRIVTGKDEDDGSASCLEPTEKEEQDEQFDNPLLQTNVLLGKSSSGVVPLLGRSMSVSLRAVCQANDSNSIINSKLLSYWHDRIAMLASLIDGACLFNKANRRGFAEEDPFSFEEHKQGLVYHILWLLHHSCRRIIPQQQSQENGDETALLSGIRLLALRTLTSLTHDNELAAEQMTQWYDFVDNHSSSSTESSSIRGIDVLAELVFELEGRGKGLADQSKKKKGRASDEELHRYDSTIFCLNTLANIIEAANVRRMLAEITVSSSSSGDEELWLKWLCRWLVSQTETFRDAILGIGKETGSRSEQRELQKHEEDKLVAAGNSCVLLACLMTEPEEISEEPESTNTIRNLILEQMPRNEGSTGVTMIINTLKAFCNFYYCSLGDLSVAIVTPVKKLIEELDNLQKTELK